MAGIRVSTGAKRIEVNDDGDYITLNFSDNSFADRFFEMIDRVQEKANASAEKAKEIDATTEENSEARARSAAKLFRTTHEEIAAEVDNFFGPGTCRKVFGDIVPGIELYDDFFQQLMPYFEEYGRERAQKLSKYRADRTGNV